jgi:hypothetical protein
VCVEENHIEKAFLAIFIFLSLYLRDAVYNLTDHQPDGYSIAIYGSVGLTYGLLELKKKKAFIYTALLPCPSSDAH